MSKFKRITLEERILIEKFIKKGVSTTEIGKILNRSKNVINVEIRRMGGKDSYDAEKAHEQSDLRNERKNKSSSGSSMSDEYLPQVKIMYEEGKSFWQIRRELKINHILLNKIFSKLNIKNIHIFDMIESIEKRISAIEICLEKLFKEKS